MEAATEKGSYAMVGYRLGKKRHVFDLEEDAILNVRNDDFARPTAALRKLFAPEERPEAGFVDCIPAH
jgi:hypothetical protein